MLGGHHLIHSRRWSKITSHDVLDVRWLQREEVSAASEERRLCSTKAQFFEGARV